MKKYLLDTNICISIIRNKYGVPDKLKSVGKRHCYVSEISIAELYYGASKSKRESQRYEDVELIRENFKIIPISECVFKFGQIKADLEIKGQRLDDFDLLIGVTALTHNFVMVSDNIKHLGRIPGIKIENWTQRNEE